MSPEQKQLIRENGIKELSEEVNGKPLNFVIGQYVERKDVGGLAEFFRAYISDAKETLEKYVDLAIKQTEERIVELAREYLNDWGDEIYPAGDFINLIRNK